MESDYARRGNPADGTLGMPDVLQLPLGLSVSFPKEDSAHRNCFCGQGSDFLPAALRSR